MNYTDISTFLTIISSPSLSKAAEDLYISQPALSHRLNALEKELGAPLIVRKKGVRTIELTEAGKRFVPIAEKWQLLWKETQEISLSSPTVPLRISNVDSLNVYFMPKVYTRFMKNNPSCRLNISTLRSNAAYQAVEHHAVDISFICNPHFFKKVHTHPLFHETMKFICSSDSPYEGTISPDDLNIEDEIFVPWSSPFLMWHDYWFGTTEQMRFSIDNMSLFEQFLHYNNAWAIVPSTIAHTLMQKQCFKTCPITNGPDARTCYAIYNNEQKNTPLLNAFITTLLNVAEQFPDVDIVEDAKTHFW